MKDYTLVKIKNSKNFIQLENHAILCPYCNTHTLPEYICANYSDYTTSDLFPVFTICNNHKCNKALITLFANPYDGKCEYKGLQAYPKNQTKEFSEIIKNISQKFIEIYNEAYVADQMKLHEICGVGYRKALEFLIKDYLITINPDKEDHYRTQILHKCIEEIECSKLKDIAKRATWLGNDQTHYEKRWENKDLNDLKNTIDIVVAWLEYEIKGMEIIESMPKNQKKS